MTKKDLKTLSEAGAATDITRYNDEKITELENREGHLEVVELTHGTYGMNGGLFKAFESGKLYVVLSRGGALFRLA